VRRARTISGSVCGRREIPVAKAVMAIDAGRLDLGQDMVGITTDMSCIVNYLYWLMMYRPPTTRRPCSVTHDQRKKAKNPAVVPFLTKAILKANWVEPGPGKALPSAKRSANVLSESQWRSFTKTRLLDDRVGCSEGVVWCRVTRERMKV
jgi:hypothetical protein